MTGLIARASRLALPLALLWKALKTPVAFGVSAIVETGTGGIVLVRHTYQPGWHLPGGGVGRGEPPAEAILRELREEIGLIDSEPPELAGLFTRRLGVTTNAIALYRVRRARYDFRPNFEISEIVVADAASLPVGTAAGTRRRLAEHKGQAVPTAYW